jgi:ATP-binding protein involved in chromosome partitioning
MAEMATRDDVLRVLSSLRDPDLGRDVVSLGMIKDLAISGGTVSFTFELTTPACPVKAQFEKASHELVGALPGVTKVDVRMTSNVRPTNPGGAGLLPGVKNLVAIASGKGGVGKSTVTANLAIALAAEGARVGLLDADIYGASIPAVMGTAERPGIDTETEKLLPVRAHGVELISMAILTKSGGDAVVWRGPMVGKVVTQMLSDVAWGELDYLLIDLPPGTGDASLSLAQAVPLTGVAVVCTPQRMAVDIAVKAAAMFRQLNVPVLGLIENMSYTTASAAGVTTRFQPAGPRPPEQSSESRFLARLRSTTRSVRAPTRADPRLRWPGAPSSMPSRSSQVSSPLRSASAPSAAFR